MKNETSKTKTRSIDVVVTDIPKARYNVDNGGYNHDRGTWRPYGKWTIVACPSGTCTGQIVCTPLESQPLLTCPFCSWSGFIDLIDWEASDGSTDLS
jgi:hypothetical protein